MQQAITFGHQSWGERVFVKILRGLTSRVITQKLVSSLFKIHSKLYRFFWVEKVFAVRAFNPGLFCGRLSTNHLYFSVDGKKFSKTHSGIHLCLGHFFTKNATMVVSKLIKQ